jgi:CMP/dCMP kinase
MEIDMKNYSIAIDGPAGSGKSTIARKVALTLSYIYVDTGAMYRAMALFIKRKQIDPDDISAISKVYKDVRIELDYIDNKQQIYLNSENVTKLLRNEEIGNMASTVSKHLNIRNKMVELQQEIALNTNVVMDGRDIGTVVLPNANLKIYLTASTLERAKRRYIDLKRKGMECNLEMIEHDIIARDYQDMNRENSPLRQGENAILIDSSHMTIDEVAAEILRLFKEKVEFK